MNKLKPYIEPVSEWVSVKDGLPKVSGKYAVAFSSRNTNFDVDDFNADIGEWDFYNKEDMVKVKWWMKLPTVPKELFNEKD